MANQAAPMMAFGRRDNPMSSLLPQQPQPLPTDAPMDPNDPFGQAMQRINAARGQDPYGAGQIGQTVNEFKNLESALQSGKLSQKDYITIGNQLRDATTPIMQRVMYGGSNAATAGTNAGAYDLGQKYYRNLDIYKAAQETLGRDLTPNELAQVTPYFGSGTAKEVDAGKAVLAQMAQADQNSPAGLEKKYQANAGQYSGEVGGIFHDLLSRGASQDEIDHFGKMLASGQVDPYTLRQFVQQMPEYQQKQTDAASATQAQQDAAARTQLGSELGQYDQDFFNKAKENVISRYTQAGIQNSPSLDFALTNLMGDIQKQRDAYMADVSRQDYTNQRGNTRQDLLNNRDLLRQDYLSNQQNMLNDSNYSRQRQASLTDMLSGRANEVADYTTQQNDLQRLLAQQQGSQRSGGLGSMVGGLAGAGLGAFLTHTPAGAQAGYQIGSGSGGIFDYLNRR